MRTSTQQTSAILQKSSGSANDIDFKSILTQFYIKHNASKKGEVAKSLQKYKRHEKEIFSKLVKKYAVSNSLDEISYTNESQMPFGSTTLTASLASPFASTTCRDVSWCVWCVAYR
jgi:hypothetical protein